MKHEVKSMADLQDEYAAYVKQSDLYSVRLDIWLPDLGKVLRPLVPGELCFFMADTGVGKSMALQNIAAAQSENVLFFELELPGTLMFERFMALSLKKPCKDIEAEVEQGIEHPLADLSHIYVCDDTKLSYENMRDIIMAESTAEKMGGKPVAVFVDYIGLMAGQGRSRYERVSAAAEGLKVLAKETNTVVIGATQISRPEDKSASNAGIHDAKDSGSIENSAGVVISLWKHPTDSETIYVKVLKNTKGAPSKAIECNMVGEQMWINERAKAKYPDLYS